MGGSTREGFGPSPGGSAPPSLTPALNARMTPLDPQREILVFVYGTLMRGENNHGLLFGSRFVSTSFTKPDFELVNLGAFPALIRAEEGEAGAAVRGEVYAVDRMILEILDEVEDHPRLYVRTPIELADGLQVQAYLLAGARAAFYPRVESGDWRQQERAI